MVIEQNKQLSCFLSNEINTLNHETMQQNKKVKKLTY